MEDGHLEGWVNDLYTLYFPCYKELKSRKKTSGGQIHQIDVRKIREVIEDGSVTATITSPPYYSMKDYLHDDQLGRGQTYSEYLDDLREIFSDIFQLTKPDGTLWVIADTFRVKKRVFMFPFDLSNRIEEAGWILTDVIIWNKGKSVPWTKKGQTRKIFEYILFFVKDSDNYKYYSDRMRSIEGLKGWWVRYPERHHPRGKSPTEIWEFTIPVQGSWGNGELEHLCPFPPELASRMIELSTDEGDTVLDPFSGVGTVVRSARNLGRVGVGTEIVESFIQQFDNDNVNSSPRVVSTVGITVEEFEITILNLRILKFARILSGQLNRREETKILSIHCELSPIIPNSSNHIASANFNILVPRGKTKLIESRIVQLISKPPFSKYGLNAIISITTGTTTFRKCLPSEMYSYTLKNTHSFETSFLSSNIPKKLPKILTNIRLELVE